MIKEGNRILLSLILRILTGTIIGLGGSAYVMIVPHPKFLIVSISYLIGAILIGWVVAEIIQHKIT